MKPTLALVVALTMLTVPLATPAAAQGPSQDAPSEPVRAFEGEHVTALVDRELPGLVDLTLAPHEDPLIQQLELPHGGSTLQADADDAGLTLRTGQAEAHLADVPNATANLEIEQGEAILLPGPNATLEEHEDGARILLDGSGLELRGDRVTIHDERVQIQGTASWQATGLNGTSAQEEAPSQDARSDRADRAPGNQNPDQDRDDRPDRGPPDRGPPEDRPSTWRPQATPAAHEGVALPYDVDARFFSLTLTQHGAQNVTLHGAELGSITFNGSQIDQVHRAGNSLHAIGDEIRLVAVDAPATQIKIDADDASTDIPQTTTLPNNATATMRLDDGSVHLQVQRPAEAVPADPERDHRPAPAIERATGPAPGLTAQGENTTTGVTSERPDRVDTRFDAALDDAEGNVSLGLEFERALLIEDTHGNGQIDVGDPAIAETRLDQGTTNVDDDTITNRFELWSGTLEVNVEPGDGTAKITYEATNLSAPPGTLFVIETQAHAPPGAAITPTSNGVIVDNGSLQAEYSLSGPVTVDGEDAWADRSILVDDDDTVRLLMAYPAGDNITHDPTVAVQSNPGAQVLSTVAASPWAVAAGALGALVLVAASVWQRRRAGP